ncbi:hypothetical protein PQQ96_15055 [Paraburkholderia sediminicola]|uniref:hypothetical protein n=1 Tax=Paraburkholderia sediminicola TaxID=458836 RepID=UPI0038BBE4BF
MDRRTFMVTSAWLSTAAGGAWPWLTHAAARHGTLAVIDSTLACGPAFADYVAHMNLPAFETGDDIGALWYTTLAPRLWQTPTQMPAALIGLIRASDYFVLKELATRVGHLVEHRYEQGTGPIANVAFALTPGLLR